MPERLSPARTIRYPVSAIRYSGTPPTPTSRLRRTANRLRAALRTVAGVADPGVRARRTGYNLPARPAVAAHHRRPEDRRPRIRAVGESCAARPDRGLLGQGTGADAEAAVAAARAAFPAWRATPADMRAGILERAADLMESRRREFNGLLILEAGKPWVEADGDTSEAIDFCRFYASEMRRLAWPEITQPTPGEHCVQGWTPRGVAVSIAPWNFPLAILTGLTVAPLVAGNAVIMKPARQTSIIGAVLMDLLMEAGVPPGVLNYLPCVGAEVGGLLTAHPQVDAIAFTGSRAVGCKIWETAGRTLPGQANLKKVVCEMGGKNALIIDNDADLDEAIPAALYSAFGYSGQKCSALSRLIVLADVHDRFLERFLAACPNIPVGDPAQPGTIVGPVIDADAQRKILGYIEQGKKEATLAWQARLARNLPPAAATTCRRQSSPA